MKKTLLKLSALLLVMVAGVTSAWADDSSLTFTAKCNGSGTADDGASWTVTSDGSESTFMSDNGIHYGTNSAQVTYIKLTTSDIQGTITKVVVNASTANSVSATASVTVGGSAFGGDAKALSTTATDYTFNGSATGEIVVTVTKPNKAAKALYVKSVVVTYTPAADPTKVSTTTTINASGITNTDLKNGTAAGTLSATVTPEGGVALASPTVKWSGNNDAVAIINATTGVVTLVGVGTVTFTATYEDDEDYNGSSNTYEMTVVDNTPSPYVWVETALGDLTTDDIFVIVGNNGSTYAMTNDNGTGSAPATPSVTIADDKITSAVANNVMWNISGNATDGYTFYPNGSTTTWLYCYTTANTGSNNNMRVGTDDRKVFEMSDNKLMTKDTYVVRYVDVYSGSDWRGYVSSSSLGTTIDFYKRTFATYTREVVEVGSWGTLCLPYDATVDGATLYTIAGKELTGAEVTSIVLEEAASMEAGKPYIFKATANSVVATYTGSEYTASGAVNGLYGTYGAIAAGAWDGYIAGDDLYLMTASNVQAANKATSSLDANRAYIYMSEVPEYNGGNVKGIRLYFDGTEETTGINNLTPAISEGNGAIYNLAGQRMETLQKGINIVNGKKVIIK